MLKTLAVLGLWSVALIVAYVELPASTMSKIAPVFAICMIGSAFIVRRLGSSSSQRDRAS